jgi:hypothetical protein
MLDLKDLHLGNYGYVQQWTCLGNQNQAWNNQTGLKGYWQGANMGSATCIDAFQRGLIPRGHRPEADRGGKVRCRSPGIRCGRHRPSAVLGNPAGKSDEDC